MKLSLPHKKPILFVDSHHIVNEEDITAKYAVPVDHPVLKGHFPHFRIWPGIHLIEGMSQTAGLHAMHLASEKLSEPGTKYVTMLSTVDKVKFRRPVMPGAKLKYFATLYKKKHNHIFYKCTVYNSTVRVAEAVIGLTAVNMGIQQ